MVILARAQKVGLSSISTTQTQWPRGSRCLVRFSRNSISLNHTSATSLFELYKYFSTKKA